MIFSPNFRVFNIELSMQLSLVIYAYNHKSNSLLYSIQISQHKFFFSFVLFFLTVLLKDTT